MEIDEHVGCAMSGLIADARTLVEHARVETQVYIGYYIHAINTLRLLTQFRMFTNRIIGSHMGSQ
jgi:20S proteasome alpha/beta subunit